MRRSWAPPCIAVEWGVRGRPLRPQLSRGWDDATKLETAKEAPRNPTVSRSMVGPSGILTRGSSFYQEAHISVSPKSHMNATEAGKFNKDIMTRRRGMTLLSLVISLSLGRLERSWCRECLGAQCNVPEQVFCLDTNLGLFHLN